MGARADLGESLAPARMRTPDRPLRGPAPILNELLVRIRKNLIHISGMSDFRGFPGWSPDLLQTPNDMKQTARKPGRQPNPHARRCASGMRRTK